MLRHLLTGIWKTELSLSCCCHNPQHILQLEDEVFLQRYRTEALFVHGLTNPVLYLSVFHHLSSATSCQGTQWPLWDHDVAGGSFGSEVESCRTVMAGEAKGMGKRGLSFTNLHVNVSAVHREVKVLAQFVSAHSYMSTGTRAERR